MFKNYRFEHGNVYEYSPQSPSTTIIGRFEGDHIVGPFREFILTYLFLPTSRGRGEDCTTAKRWLLTPNRPLAFFLRPKCFFTTVLLEYLGLLWPFLSVDLSFQWVPGHAGLPGNELENSLAKTGGTLSSLRR